MRYYFAFQICALVYRERDKFTINTYRGVNIGLYVLLSRTQAGPGRTVKKEQDEIYRNHVQTFIFPSVF